MTTGERGSQGDAVGELLPVEGNVLMTHDVGLHARPSVTLTKLAKRFHSDVSISVAEDGPWIDAKSIARVMKMKAPRDTVLYFRALGEDADAAVKALVELVASDFGAAPRDG